MKIFKVYLQVEIGDADITIKELTNYVHDHYGYFWKFVRIEQLYKTAPVAIFERVQE